MGKRLPSSGRPGAQSAGVRKVAHGTILRGSQLPSGRANAAARQSTNNQDTVRVEGRPLPEPKTVSPATAPGESSATEATKKDEDVVDLVDELDDDGGSPARIPDSGDDDGPIDDQTLGDYIQKLKADPVVAELAQQRALVSNNRMDHLINELYAKSKHQRGLTDDELTEPVEFDLAVPLDDPHARYEFVSDVVGARDHELVNMSWMGHVDRSKYAIINKKLMVEQKRRIPQPRGAESFETSWVVVEDEKRVKQVMKAISLQKAQVSE